MISDKDRASQMLNNAKYDLSLMITMQFNYFFLHCQIQLYTNKTSKINFTLSMKYVGHVYKKRM